MPACARVSCRPPRCSSVSGRRSRCSPGWPDMPAGYSNVMPRHCWLPRTLLQSSSRPLLYAALPRTPAAELARTDRGDEALDQLNAAFDTYMRPRSARRCAPGGPRVAPVGCGTAHCQPAAGKNGLGQPHRLRAQGGQPDRTGRDQPRRRHAAAPLPHTVKTHVHNAFAKLGITSRAQLTQVIPGSD